MTRKRIRVHVGLNVALRGAHPPEAMMHFHPVSGFSPNSEKLSASVDNFYNFIFSQQIFQFSSANVSGDFFSHWAPLLRENYYFPITVANVPLDFVKFACFLHKFCVFRFPLVWPWCIYASHNSRTGRLWSLYDRLLRIIKTLWYTLMKPRKTISKFDRFFKSRILNSFVLGNSIIQSFYVLICDLIWKWFLK